MTHEEFVKKYQAGKLDTTFNRWVSSQVLDSSYLFRLNRCKYVQIYGQITWLGTMVMFVTPILFILTGLFLSWWLAPPAVVLLIVFVRIRDRIKDRAMIEVVIGDRELYESLMGRGQMRIVERLT